MIADLKCCTVDDQQLINEVQNWSNIIISHVIQNDQQYYKLSDDVRHEETRGDNVRYKKTRGDDVRHEKTRGDDDRWGATMIWLGSLVFNFIINKAVVRLVWSLSLL